MQNSVSIQKMKAIEKSKNIAKSLLQTVMSFRDVLSVECIFIAVHFVF